MSKAQSAALKLALRRAYMGLNHAITSVGGEPHMDGVAGCFSRTAEHERTATNHGYVLWKAGRGRGWARRHAVPRMLGAKGDITHKREAPLAP